MRFLQCSLDQVPETKKASIGVIGAGPAGLAAAGYLVCREFNVVVYDQMPEPGGLLLYGIPEHRMPRQRVREAVRELARAGVEFRTSTRVVSCEQEEPPRPPYTPKRMLCLEDLARDHDALLLATGAWQPRSLGVKGEDLAGVYKAFTWLVMFHLERLGYNIAVPPLAGTLMVVGAGHTAADAVEVPARYLGTVRRIILSYRRTRREAPMGQARFEQLVRDYGVEPLEQTLPISFEGKTCVERVVLVRTELDESGNPRVVPGTEFTVEVDNVLIAVGEKPTPPFTREWMGVKLDSRGRVVAHEGRTGNPRVYAAGDLVLGPSRVGYALRSGLEAAKAIAERLAPPS